MRARPVSHLFCGGIRICVGISDRLAERLRCLGRDGCVRTGRSCRPALGHSILRGLRYRALGALTDCFVSNPAPAIHIAQCISPNRYLSQLRRSPGANAFAGPTACASTQAMGAELLAIGGKVEFGGTAYCVLKTGTDPAGEAAAAACVAGTPPARAAIRKCASAVVSGGPLPGNRDLRVFAEHYRNGRRSAAKAARRYRKEIGWQPVQRR